MARQPLTARSLAGAYLFFFSVGESVKERLQRTRQTFVGSVVFGDLERPVCVGAKRRLWARLWLVILGALFANRCGLGRVW